MLPRPTPAPLPARHARIVCVLALVFLCALTVCAQAAQPGRTVGFLSLGFSEPEENSRLDVNVWYPASSRSQRTVRLQAWTFRAASGAGPAEGSFPLILLSHPSAGSRFTLHDTASDLAARGFVVAALTHPRDNLDCMPEPYTWALFANRTRDLARVPELLLRHRTLGPAIDPGRLGLLGFGAGGTAALILGGALPECTDWPAFCRDAPPEKALLSLYCNEWAKARVGKEICEKLPLKKSLADTRFKAVAAVNPSFPMLFTANALNYFRPALFLVSGGKIKEEKAGKAALEALAGRFPEKPRTLYLSGGTPAALMAECPDELRWDLPELCGGVEPDLRRELHRLLVSALADFFEENLVRKTPGPLPDPPVLEFVGPPRPPVQEEKHERPRRRTRSSQTPKTPSPLPPPVNF